MPRRSGAAGRSEATEDELDQTLASIDQTLGLLQQALVEPGHTRARSGGERLLSPQRSERLKSPTVIGGAASLDVSAYTSPQRRLASPPRGARPRQPVGRPRTAWQEPEPEPEASGSSFGSSARFYRPGTRSHFMVDTRSPGPAALETPRGAEAVRRTFGTRALTSPSRSRAVASPERSLGSPTRDRALASSVWATALRRR